MAKRKAPIDDDPRWTSKLPPAPGDLRIVQAFLNSAPLNPKPDPSHRRALTDCLELWGLLPPDTQLDDEDFQRANQVCLALRSLAAAHTGKPRNNDAATAILNQAMTSATLRLRFAATGQIRFEPSASGLDGALSRLCGIVAVAQIDGNWRFMKICAGQRCRAAYFDSSKSAKRKWCSTQCSSLSTSLAYRQRNLQTIRDKDRGNALHRRFNRRHGL